MEDSRQLGRLKHWRLASELRTYYGEGSAALQDGKMGKRLSQGRGQILCDCFTSFQMDNRRIQRERTVCRALEITSGIIFSHDHDLYVRLRESRNCQPVGRGKDTVLRGGGGV